jgi:hypothetical protein
VNKPVKPPHIDAAELQPYADAGVTLIPLRQWNSQDYNGNPTGKLPRKGWRTNAYNTPKVIANSIKTNRNTGWRIGDGWIALDFDPRNAFGDDELSLLLAKYGIDPATLPTMESGGSGVHVYFRVPKGMKFRNTVPGFSAVEVKGVGRFVVCAGSIHPSGKMYCWRDGCPPLSEAPDVPADFLEVIKRPEPAANFADDSARITPEQLATMLAALPVDGFNTNDTWEPILMAAHHATGGAGLPEFIEWSTQDPAFGDHAAIIEARWNSLDSNKGDGRTIGTLNKALIDARHPELVARPSADDDFGAEAPKIADAEPEDEESFDFEGKPPKTGADNEMLMELNGKYCAVTTGGKYRIMYQARNAKGPDWEWTSKTDFLSLHENRKIFSADNPDKTVPLGLSWQQWPRRRTASGTTFDASLEAGALDVDNNLNLWLGWAIQPKRGTWTRFKAMIEDDICSGDSNAAEYFFNWAAWKFQHPGELPGTAFAMRGNKGTGKGTLGEAFVNIFGNHAIATSSMDHVFGRFNGHMERILFAFADEALWAGDPRQDARLKKLVTDRDAMFEHKNIQPYPGINRTAVMLATNDDWVVPATEGERRYCVVRTSGKHQCPEGEPNHPNRPYWNAIYAELRSGGLAAFLHAMLHRPLPPGWHPRAHVPLTQELAEQKARSLKGVVGFYFERLQTGLVTETLEGTSQDWSGGELRVSPTEFWEACRDWIHMTNPRATVTRRGVSNELKRFGWDIGDHLKQGQARDRYWLCPALDTARAKFNEALKGKMFD